MKKKVKEFDKLYHGNDFENKNEFESQRLYGLKKFTQSHPKVMKDWISQNKNPVDIMSLPLHWSNDIPGLYLSDCLESLTGYRLGEFKNYKLL